MSNYLKKILFSILILMMPYMNTVSKAMLEEDLYREKIYYTTISIRNNTYKDITVNNKYISSHAKWVKEPSDIGKLCTTDFTFAYLKGGLLTVDVSFQINRYGNSANVTPRLRMTNGSFVESFYINDPENDFCLVSLGQSSHDNKTSLSYQISKR